MGSLWAKIKYLKSHSKALGFNLHIDLLNEVLNIDLDEGAARYQGSKLGFKKNICWSARLEPMRPGLAELADVFFKLQLWPTISLQPLNQIQYSVPHLKDLFHIHLETKVQGCWMTFKVFNLCSNWLHLHRIYVLRICNNLGSTVSSGSFWAWKNEVPM